MEFSKCWGSSKRLDDHMLLDDHFARYSHSCLLGSNGPLGRMGVKFLVHHQSMPYKLDYHKWKETEKTPASQTWPKWSDTALHSLLKSVRRIGSSEEWVRSNLAASKSRSLAISLSRPYECRRRTNSLFILGLEV